MLTQDGISAFQLPFEPHRSILCPLNTKLSLHWNISSDSKSKLFPSLVPPVGIPGFPQFTGMHIGMELFHLPDASHCIALFVLFNTYPSEQLKVTIERKV